MPPQRAPARPQDRRSGDRRRTGRRREDVRQDATGWRDLHRPARILLFVLIVLALIEIYHQAQFFVDRVFGVLLLFVFAAIIAMLVTPLVDALERLEPLRGRRGLAVLAMNGVLVVALGAFLGALIPSLVSQGTAFSEQAPRLTNEIQGWLNGVQQTLQQRGIPVHLDTGSAIQSFAAPLLGSAFGIVSGTVGVIVSLLLITVISVYLELQGRELLATLRQLFPRQQDVFDFSVVAAGTTLAGYVRGQVIFASLMAVYTGLALWVIGVHFALVIAVITFFLELVPIVGAPIAIGLACAVGVSQGTSILLLAGAASLIGHLVGAYTIGIQLMSRATRVHPLVALAALLLGAQLGGVLGALFAVPIAGILNVYAGALWRARRGKEAFVVPETTIHDETTLEQLPSLGDEITQKAEEHEAASRAPAPKRRRAPRPAETAAKG